ncbi:MAG: type II toxin-antitoxin system RelE/ParE family toxin [Chakrabartia sp.]
MHTVVETPTYLAAAAKAGMTETERVAAVDQIAADPQGGEVISGGGGARKVRVAGRGKGKSGGYRILTYFMTEDEPVFLISVISKSKSANLSDVQKAEVKSVAKDIRDER